MLQEDNMYGYNNETDVEHDYKNVSRYLPAHRKKKNQLERQIRKAKYLVRRLTLLVRLLMYILLIGLCYVILNLRYWKLNPMAFSSLNNTSIKIENNYIASSDRILRAIQLCHIDDKPIYLMNTDSIKESILKIPPIKNVYIRRYWLPARIEILVQEREPAITIAPNENVAPIAFYTKDGTPIGRAYLPLNPMFKTVKVLTYGTYTGKGRIDASKIKFITTIAKDIEQASKEPVQYIDWRNPDDIYVQIPTVKIKLGSVSPLTYPDTLKKINGLPSILPKIKILNKKVKYLDLRWQNNLYYIKLAE